MISTEFHSANLSTLECDTAPVKNTSNIGDFLSSFSKINPLTFDDFGKLLTLFPLSEYSISSKEGSNRLEVSISKAKIPVLFAVTYFGQHVFLAYRENDVYYSQCLGSKEYIVSSSFETEKQVKPKVKLQGLKCFSFRDGKTKYAVDTKVLLNYEKALQIQQEVLEKNYTSIRKLQSFEIKEEKIEDDCSDDNEDCTQIGNGSLNKRDLSAILATNNFVWTKHYQTTEHSSYYLTTLHDFPRYYRFAFIPGCTISVKSDEPLEKISNAVSKYCDLFSEYGAVLPTSLYSNLGLNCDFVVVETRNWTRREIISNGEVIYSYIGPLKEIFSVEALPKQSNYHFREPPSGYWLEKEKVTVTEIGSLSNDLVKQLTDMVDLDFFRTYDHRSFRREIDDAKYTYTANRQLRETVSYKGNVEILRIYRNDILRSRIESFEDAYVATYYGDNGLETVIENNESTTSKTVSCNGVIQKFTTGGKCKDNKPTIEMCSNDKLLCVPAYQIPRINTVEFECRQHGTKSGKETTTRAVVYNSVGAISSVDRFELDTKDFLKNLRNYNETGYDMLSLDTEELRMSRLGYKLAYYLKEDGAARHCCITLLIPRDAIVAQTESGGKHRTDVAVVLSIEPIGKTATGTYTVLREVGICEVCQSDVATMVSNSCAHKGCSKCWSEIVGKVDAVCPICSVALTGAALLESSDVGKIKVANALFSANFQYRVGDYIKVNNYSKDQSLVCVSGIHYFVNLSDVYSYCGRGINIPTTLTDDTTIRNFAKDEKKEVKEVDDEEEVKDKEVEEVVVKDKEVKEEKKELELKDFVIETILLEDETTTLQESEPFVETNSLTEENGLRQRRTYGSIQ